MRPILNLIIFLVISSAASAQKVELSVSANAGLFRYTGISAARQTFFNNFNSPSGIYANNPYGNKNAFSYGAGLQLKLISKTGLIAGLQAGYDVLRSKIDVVHPPITYLGPVLTTGIYIPVNDLNGHSVLQNSFINLNPFIGYRIWESKFTLDIMPGVDVGLGLSSKEHSTGKAEFTNTETQYSSNINYGEPKTDLRIRLGLEAGYQRWGVSASYASGKSNYLRGSIGGNPEVYSSLMRFGLSYKIF